MKELRSEIEIHAPAERVWHLLTDFGNYPRWNPFIRHARGKLQAGERLEVTIQPSHSRKTIFHPIVLKVVQDCELRWSGHFFVSGLFDGEHIFMIEPLGNNRVRFIQQEIFTGLLVPLFARALDNDTQRGFKEMNQALKTRAEHAED